MSTHALEVRHVDMSAWPRDPKAPHRFLCTPAQPMPTGARGQWSHTNIVGNGGCSQGCCDDWKCNDCGHCWREEVAD